MQKYILYLFILLMSISYLEAAQKPPHKHTKEQMNQVCTDCHDMREGKKYFHRPVSTGACTACHNLALKRKNLLRIDDSPELCIVCHRTKATTYYEDKYQHPAIKKRNCTGCHDPHAGDIQYRLKYDKRKDLCLSCHKEKKKYITSVKNQHGAIFLKDGGCFFCHDPHGTNRPKMLKAPTTKELCLRCHNKPIRRQEDGKMLKNMAEFLKNHNKQHPPIVAGECTGCHNPHGSNNYRMLRGKFPKRGITKFKPENYFCFICHDTKKITQSKTTKYTNFRRGEKNLHTIHVKYSSISCPTCHELHAVSRDIPLLRDKTTFQRTKFNLNYLKKPNGGSCNPICHNKREYNRGKSAKR